MILTNNNNHKTLILFTMKTLYIKKTKFRSLSLFLFLIIIQVTLVSAQNVLFDFDNAPIHTSLPIDQTVNGITAHFSATGQGFSIQDNSSPVVPIGFTGRFIYPNSIYLADLLINFDQTLTDFSIWYSCQELGCDDAATMRVTAFKNGNIVVTNTKTATNPGTWPVDTLSCSFSSGFDSVVVHYDSHPPTCQDYGVIFLADNMRVTSLNFNGIQNQQSINEELIISNPVSQFTTISFALSQSDNIQINIYDITGKLIKNIFNETASIGMHQVNLNVAEIAMESGLYFIKLTGKNFSRSSRLVVVK